MQAFRQLARCLLDQGPSSLEALLVAASHGSASRQILQATPKPGLNRLLQLRPYAADAGESKGKGHWRQFADSRLSEAARAGGSQNTGEDAGSSIEEDAAEPLEAQPEADSGASAHEQENGAGSSMSLEGKPFDPSTAAYREQVLARLQAQVDELEAQGSSEEPSHEPEEDISQSDATSSSDETTSDDDLADSAPSDTDSDSDSELTSWHDQVASPDSSGVLQQYDPGDDEGWVEEEHEEEDEEWPEEEPEEDELAWLGAPQDDSLDLGGGLGGREEEEEEFDWLAAKYPPEGPQFNPDDPAHDFQLSQFKSVNPRGTTYTIKELLEPDQGKFGQDVMPRPAKLDKPMERAHFMNIRFLNNYVDERGKLHKRKMTGLRKKEQRRVSRALKTSRALGLMPYLWKLPDDDPVISDDITTELYQTEEEYDEEMKVLEEAQAEERAKARANSQRSGPLFSSDLWEDRDGFAAKQDIPSLSSILGKLSRP